MAVAHQGGGRRRCAQGGAGPQQARRGDGLSASGGRREMKKPFVVLITLLLAGTPALAADIKSLDLGKNAQVWFAEDHTVPIVSLVAALPAGSAYDPSGKPGLAAFTASLI